MVASGRLGCCCVVGCPGNSISPLDSVNTNAIEDRPVESFDVASESGESTAESVAQSSESE